MIACSNSNMPQQMTQCYKCYGKLFGVVGQRATQMYQSAYMPTMTAVMNLYSKTSLCSRDNVW